MTKTLVVNARWEIVNGTPSLLAWAPTGAQEMVNGKLVNGKCEMKSYLKSELARAAGVSCSTFKRWLRQQSEMFCQWGVTPRTQLLPPVAVQWICKAYGIDEGDLWTKPGMMSTMSGRLSTCSVNRLSPKSGKDTFWLLHVACCISDFSFCFRECGMKFYIIY